MRNDPKQSTEAANAGARALTKIAPVPVGIEVVVGTLEEEIALGLIGPQPAKRAYLRLARHIDRPSPTRADPI